MTPATDLTALWWMRIPYYHFAQTTGGAMENMTDIAEGRRLLAAIDTAKDDWQIVAADRFERWLTANGSALLAELEAARRDAGRYRWIIANTDRSPQLLQILNADGIAQAIDAALDAGGGT